MVRNLFFIAVLCVAAIAACSPVMAEVINVDFGPNDNSSSGVYAGTAAAPDLGTIWNDVRPGVSYPNLNTVLYTSGALVDSLGGATTATVTVSPNFYTYDEGLAQSGVNSTIAPELLHDYIFTETANGGTSYTVSIDGLTPGGLYDLYLYSDTGAQATNFDISGDVKNVTNTNTPGGETAFVLGSNYQLYSGLTAAGGTLSVSVTGATGPYYGVVNGLQVVAVPEPGTLALLAAGLIGLLAIRRRK